MNNGHFQAIIGKTNIITAESTYLAAYFVLYPTQKLIIKNVLYHFCKLYFIKKFYHKLIISLFINKIMQLIK